MVVFAQDPTMWSGDCVVDGVATIKGLECLFTNVLRVATTVGGLAFGAMLIVGGFKWITSGGDPKGVKEAQGTITSALLGLALMVVAWFILRIIQEITGANVTEFQIP